MRPYTDFSDLIVLFLSTYFRSRQKSERRLCSTNNDTAADIHIRPFTIVSSLFSPLNRALVCSLHLSGQTSPPRLSVWPYLAYAVQKRAFSSWALTSFPSALHLFHAQWHTSANASADRNTKATAIEAIAEWWMHTRLHL